MANTKRTWPKGVAAAIGDPVPAEKLTIVLAGAAGPPQECRVALSAWLCKPSTPEVTFGRVAELAIRYASRLEATGVASMTSATAEDASGFVRAPTRKGAPPSVHTMHLRRTTLRSIYRTLHELGAPCGDPTAFMELPSRWFRAQRPLTNAEIHQLRTAVMTRRGDPPAGAVLLASAQLFTALRIAGGLYLVWLGVRTWRSRGQQWVLDEPVEADPKRVFAESFAVTATNPKSIAFFVAFVPQFINPAAPWLPQTALLIVTFVLLGGLNALAYGWLAGRARGVMMRPETRRRVARTSGGVLVAGGAAVIATAHT